MTLPVCAVCARTPFLPRDWRAAGLVSHLWRGDRSPCSQWTDWDLQQVFLLLREQQTVSTDTLSTWVGIMAVKSRLPLGRREVISKH